MPFTPTPDALAAIRAKFSLTPDGKLIGSTGYFVGGSGRVMIGRVDGKSRHLPASRVAWLLAHGAWPTGYVGFRDKNPANLSPSNLYRKGT